MERARGSKFRRVLGSNVAVFLLFISCRLVLLTFLGLVTVRREVRVGGGR